VTTPLLARPPLTGAPQPAGGTVRHAGSHQPAGATPGPAAPGTTPASDASLSPSRAGDFLTCPMLYRFRVVDRFPEPPSRSAARGTLVHAVLERLFELPAGDRRPAAASAMVLGEWQRLLAAEPELADLFGRDDDGAELAAWLSGARQLVEGYFRLEDPTRFEPAGRELAVAGQVTLADGRSLQLRGVVDRLDVAPTGELRVVDYKSGRAPGTGWEQRAMFQLLFYGLVLWRSHGVAPTRLQLIYLGSGEVLHLDPDEADLRAVQRKVVALWAAIERASATGDWRPNPGRLCQACPHRARCPAGSRGELRVGPG
jgi:putative RecB family exonuclease